MHVERRQQSAAIAVGVDADQMPQVDAECVEICRVAHDRGLAGNVWPRHAVAQRVPTQVMHRLLAQRQQRIVRRVGKKVSILFIAIDHRVEKLAMVGRYKLAIAVEPITVQSAEPAVLEPDVMVEFAAENIEHHFLVIAHDGNHASATSELDQHIEHRFRIGAAVDVIAQQDQGVVGIGRDRSDQSAQRPVTTVDIANRYQSLAQRRGSFVLGTRLEQRLDAKRCRSFVWNNRGIWSVRNDRRPSHRARETTFDSGIDSGDRFLGSLSTRRRFKLACDQ